MDGIIIISNDICIAKEIINVINNIFKKDLPLINIYTFDEFKKNSYEVLNKKKYLYFIDIYSYENESLNIILKYKNLLLLNKVIIINLNNSFNNLIEGCKCVDFCLIKNGSFYKRLYNTVLNIKNNLTSKLQISSGKIPVTLNINSLNGIYNFSNDESSICYDDKNILISSSDLNKVVDKNKFYISKDELIYKRRHYDDKFKQFIVDLHVYYDIDYLKLSNYFNVDIKDIKRWVGLKKYNRKINVIRILVGKFILKFYIR